MSGWRITDNFIQGATLGFLLGGGRRNKVLRNRLSSVATGVWLLPSGITTEKSDCQQILGKRVKELLVRSVHRILYCCTSVVGMLSPVQVVADTTDCMPNVNSFPALSGESSTRNSRISRQITSVFQSTAIFPTTSTTVECSCLRA